MTILPRDIEFILHGVVLGLSNRFHEDNPKRRRSSINLRQSCLGKQTMQTWRRCLTTSAWTLSHQRSSPMRFRCSQILEAFKMSGELSRLQDDCEIQVRGFVRSVRKQKRCAFAEISDGSTIQSLQAVLTPDQASRYFCIFICIKAESATHSRERVCGD